MRGPQGTGPFRNASAGAIRVRSRRPTGNYGAQLRSSLGRYDTKGDKGARNALIQDYEGALEMPIVADSLSSRFAFRLREADPYKTNGCGNATPVRAARHRPAARSDHGPIAGRAESAMTSHRLGDDPACRTLAESRSAFRRR